MKFYLRDKNPAITKAWNIFFKDIPEFEVSTGWIFEGPKADALVSPANSFGFMDGGIDAVYTAKFGEDLSKRLRDHINKYKYGELLVGDAVIIETNHHLGHFPYLIAAPTMRCPKNVSKTVNAYLAFRAVLIAIKEWNACPQDQKIESVLCPGLATAVGEMPAWNSARQMYEAYKSVWLDQPMKLETLTSGDWLTKVWEQNSEMTAWGVCQNPD